MCACHSHFTNVLKVEPCFMQNISEFFNLPVAFTLIGITLTSNPETIEDFSVKLLLFFSQHM